MCTCWLNATKLCCSVIKLTLLLSCYLAAAASKLHLDEVVLDGKMDDGVQVYDTCDEIRRKINAHLKIPGVTQASFLRAISSS
ncbi:hypothetical protein EJ02DRAFT_473407 [Clathrospora elynae]|uniref:DUF7726 domain-containing protein n=1 Tax=Clathrospora elynae TaxID=706981 RepID=A0A6A5SER7_9PLEO|nr:hypothetical protein EJ02DRAFT_473407 [Clathrospora elynae]